jgi:DNA-binding MarR family transcriptional regulator
MIEDSELLQVLECIVTKGIDFNNNEKQMLIFVNNNDNFKENNFKNFYYSNTVIDIIKNYYKIEDASMITLENRLIKLISDKKESGQKYAIIDNLDDMQEIGLNDSQRFEALIDDLELRGLIKKGNTEVSGGSSWFRLELTNDGYKRLEEVEKNREEQKENSDDILTTENIESLPKNPTGLTALNKIIYETILELKNNLGNFQANDVWIKIKQNKNTHSEVITEISDDKIVWKVPKTAESKNKTRKQFDKDVSRFKVRYFSS